MNKRYHLTAVLVLVAALLVGCSGSDEPVSGQPTESIQSETTEKSTDEKPSSGEESERTVSSGPSDIYLSVTTDYGNTLIFENTIPYEEGWTVYDVMMSETTIDTDYGGSFISGINGVSSSMKGADGRRWDWFYYVNGVCADVGPLDYEMQPGDSIWWDYHGWQGSGAANSTVTGGYQALFTLGYDGRSGQVQLIFADGYEETAAAIGEQMEAMGADGIRLQGLESSEGLISDRIGPTLVIGDWQGLSQVAFLSDLNERYEKTGQFQYYSNSGTLDLMSPLNETAMTLEQGSGSIFTHGEGLGDENPLWILTGTDNEGVAKAAELLTKNRDVLRNTYSLAVEGDTVITLPMVTVFNSN